MKKSFLILVSLFFTTFLTAQTIIDVKEAFKKSDYMSVAKLTSELLEINAHDTLSLYYRALGTYESSLDLQGTLNFTSNMERAWNDLSKADSLGIANIEYEKALISSALSQAYFNNDEKQQYYSEIAIKNLRNLLKNSKYNTIPIKNLLRSNEVILERFKKKPL
ncbi:hypothetical protein ACR79R_21270 [Sphingobacterium spiritivorum]|uniref:hypothetical protein n=1 Tax=Sphingobacterium spiritivorum TaxID=258 RepID=UPI003DA32D50